MTKTFAICHGAGLDYCANCQRWCDNQPEASKDPRQQWIAETTHQHCAYFMGRQIAQDLAIFGVSITKDGKRVNPLDVVVADEPER